ncbi:MAG: ATP-binding protein [Acidimicrobiaceae bacterium]|nr:ATP-binding protein [Acidimicrobiaceae bacterium]
MDSVETIQPGDSGDFSIVSPSLTVQAMRDSGYKDTDHALAELIDNSIDAHARTVELIAVEKPRNPSVPHSRARISEIAVADDGTGMGHVTLRRALRYGDGTRLDRVGGRIGRFGMGLPNASMSQCTRVDVWTWKNGPDNALRSYLDLEKIKKGMNYVPDPWSDPVPDRWREVAGSTVESSGTLVVWSQLDRVRWRGAEKTIERTAELCGRIYRKFLTCESRPVSISLILAEGSESKLTRKSTRKCYPNDPLYLMAPSSAPEPFHDKPMFQDFNSRIWPVDQLNGQIKVSCSLARPDAINKKRSEIVWPKSYPKAGDAPWGKHANRNNGVSIVRAQRELELSLAWTNNYQPEERWWSVEVEFDSALDEIFGVTNNKQHAHAFVKGAGFKWQDHADPDETRRTFIERLKEAKDPRAHLIEVWEWIDNQIRRMREERKKIMKGTGTSRSRHPQTGEEVEDVATGIIRKQAEGGDLGTSDEAPDIPPEEKISQIATSAMSRRVDEETALEWAEQTVDGGRRVLMRSVTLGHKHAFFDVESVNNIVEVWLNAEHPVHEHLIEVMSGFADDESPAELLHRLEKASFTLKMILIAWARHEDKVGTSDKEWLKDARMAWGREARKFLDSSIEQ